MNKKRQTPVLNDLGKEYQTVFREPLGLGLEIKDFACQDQVLALILA